MISASSIKTAKAAERIQRVVERGRLLAADSTADSRIVVVVAASTPGNPTPISYKKPPMIKDRPTRAPVDTKRTSNLKTTNVRRVNSRTWIALFRACGLVAVVG
jgi:hypothetical protein